MSNVLFPTSVIGSLPRPRFVKDLIADDSPIKNDEYRRLMEASIQAAVAMQEAAGAGKPKKKLEVKPGGKSAGGPTNAASPELANLRNHLTDALACRVSVSSLDGKKGKLEIYFETLDDLQVLLDKLEIEL